MPAAQPVAQGAFVARLNADLSVQWLQPLPNASLGLPRGQSLVVDQQGNVSVGYSVRLPNGNVELEVQSFNPSGRVRAGFPVRWAFAAIDTFVSMVVDAQSNLHVYSMVPAARMTPNAFARRLVYTVVGGGDGRFVRPAELVPAPNLDSAFAVYAWDVAVDSMGQPSFTVSVEPPGGRPVTSWLLGFRANTMGMLEPRAGFPVEAAGAQAFARPTNALTNTPTQTLVVQQGAQVGAYDVTSGVSRAGFPAEVRADGNALTASRVDPMGNIWMLTSVTQANRSRAWFSSLTPSGQARSGFPRIFGLGTDTAETPEDLTLDPAGTAYIGMRQLGVRYLIVRQPAL
jgi:hypothetical protein